MHPKYARSQDHLQLRPLVPSLDSRSFVSKTPIGYHTPWILLLEFSDSVGGCEDFVRAFDCIGVFVHGAGHKEPEASPMMVRGPSSNPNPHEKLILEHIIHHAMSIPHPNSSEPGVFLMCFRWLERWLRG